MLAILAKQWIGAFSTRMRAPVVHLRHWAHRHRAFREGLNTWSLNGFISMLSVALHVAVALFLTGLIIHIHSLDSVIFLVVLGLSALALAFYLAATVMPLFYGACPTITPVLIHARQLVLPLLRIWQRSDKRSETTFSESEVLGAKPVAWWDVAVLAWMTESLQAGDDINVTLDALGPIDVSHLENLEHRFGSAISRMLSLARQRISPLISAQAAVLDSAAVARVLRACLSLGAHAPWSLIDAGALYFSPLPTRTHDVFLLAGALKLDIIASGQTINKDLLRKDLMAVLEPLSAWNLQHEYNIQEPDVMLLRTRGLFLHSVERCIESIADELTIADWIRIILAFRTMRDACNRFHIKFSAAPAMRRLLDNTLATEDGNALSILQDGWLEILRFWTVLYTGRDMYNTSLPVEQYPLPSQHAIWACYLSALESYYSFPDIPILPLVHAYKLLAPFEDPPSGWLKAMPEYAIHITSSLLFDIGRPLFSDGCWSAAPASSIFNLLQAMTRQFVAPGSEFVTFFARIVNPASVLSAPGSHHAISIPKESLESPIRTLADTALNLLLPRSRDDGQTASLWQLVTVLVPRSSAHRFNAWYFTHLGAAAVDLAVGLSIAMQLGHNVTDMAEQLLGDSSSFATILLSGSTFIDAFELARHARIVAPDWWEDAKTGVVAAGVQDAVLAGYPTAEAFVEAIDQAGPCERCAHTVQKMRATREEHEIANAGLGTM